MSRCRRCRHAGCARQEVAVEQVAAVFNDTLKTARDAFGDIETFSDYSDMIASSAVDAIVVVTPTNLHLDVVTRAAAAGIHVLCEKPMAMDGDECRRMIDACEAGGVKLQIGFMRLFDRGFCHARQQIEAGAIGKVVLVKSLTHGPSRPQPWKLDVSKNYGPLAEVPSHHIDTLRWMAGSDITEVYALAGNYRAPTSGTIISGGWRNTKARWRPRGALRATQPGNDQMYAMTAQNLTPTARQTFHFIGVTTAKSSIMRVVPNWSGHLGLGDVVIRGID